MDSPVRSLHELADLTTPMAVRVAATLGLVDHAGTQGATAEHLADRTGAVPSALRRLLDHLVTVDIFDHDVDTDLYRATELGSQMGQDAPAGIRPLLDIHAAGGRTELAFVDLLTTITTGTPAYVQRYGQDFWSDIDAEPSLRRSFDAQMNWRFRTQAAQIAARFDWSRFSEIIAVGGGDGQLLAEILRVHPDLRGRVLELAPSAAAATARFAAAGVQERAGAVCGSFFDPLPVGIDAYLLCDILHDWDDEHARAILSGCRHAVRPGGTVVVIDAVRGQGTGTAMDLHMLMCFGGRERTVDELALLAADCGLSLRATNPVSDGRTALEFGIVPAEQVAIVG